MTRLERMRGAVARLLTDPLYAAALFETPPEAARSLGLEPGELATLQRIDARALRVASEGYVGKRLERVAGRYPMTLALLGRRVPSAFRGYLATSFSPSEEEEWAAFVSFVSKLRADRADDERLVRDVLALESAWPPHREAPLPRFRASPDALVARSPEAVVFAAEGPLGDALRSYAAGGGADPYPLDPARWLALGASQVERLEGVGLALWERCDGRSTLGELAVGPAEARLRGWLRAGAIVTRPRARA